MSRAPSAVLKENQKDQDSLPEDEVLDALIEGYVELIKGQNLINEFYHDCQCNPKRWFNDMPLGFEIRHEILKNKPC